MPRPLPRLAACALLLALVPTPSLAASEAAPTFVFTVGAAQLGDANGSFAMRYVTPAVSGYAAEACFDATPGATEFGVLWQEYLVARIDGKDVLSPFGSLLHFKHEPLKDGRVVEVHATGHRTVVVDEQRTLGGSWRTCFRADYLATAALPWDVVAVVGTRNASATGGITYAVPTAGAVAFPWNHTGGDAAFASRDDFSAPGARAADSTFGSDPGHVLAAGGTLGLNATDGVYGGLRYVAGATRAHAAAVLTPQGVLLAGPRIPAGLPPPASGGHHPEQFAGTPGDYLLLHGATLGAAETQGLVAAWIDAPMPPGVHPRA